MDTATQTIAGQDLTLAETEKADRCLHEPDADLRRGIVDHLALGPVDGYHWILLMAATLIRFYA